PPAHWQAGAPAVSPQVPPWVPQTVPVAAAAWTQVAPPTQESSVQGLSSSQSTAVSSPFWTPSSQRAATQRPPAQRSLAQPSSFRHGLPGHAPQVPPQSTPVSAPLTTPSAQLGAVQVSATPQLWLAQSVSR